MIIDNGLPDFVPGGASSRPPIRFAPTGPPPMITVTKHSLSYVHTPTNSVSRWGVSRSENGFSRKWSLLVEDEPMEETEDKRFIGEEDLLPSKIPESVWLSHFRQADGDLSDRKEIEYLLQLYKQTSGRWPVIYDRWQSHPIYGLRGKSLESLKSKFNKVVSRLLEIDFMQRRKPTSNNERTLITQQLKFLPLFSSKFNEKNEFLRRSFLLNAFRKGNTSDVEKLCNDLNRVAISNMKKKFPQQKPPLTPGPHAASGLLSNIQTEVTASEYLRVKGLLKSVGVDRNSVSLTPRTAKLLAIVEKEVASLLMMRDSLQRKKQELEILRSTGSNQGNMRMRANMQPTPTPLPSVGNTITPSLQTTPANVTQAMPLSQQKRKR